MICTWLYNDTGGSLLIIVLYHAAINLPITVLITPLGSQMAQPFLIYVALTVVAAVIIVIVTGAETPVPHRPQADRAALTTPALDREKR